MNGRPVHTTRTYGPYGRKSIACNAFFRTARTYGYSVYRPLNCDSLSLLSNPDFKVISFLLFFVDYSTYLFRQRLCSCLMALWRYINFFIIIYYYYPMHVGRFSQSH